ncbi:MAG TPA: hypothetical protein VG755_07785 [Nannocystaceae bacterium]|nr:hypothetical protein [Nannocystaceae bacterium]
MLALGLAACTDVDDDGDGTLRVGLWGQGSSGEVYSLQDAVFQISGNGVDQQIATADLADGTSAVSTPLPAGDYSVQLLDGWHVERGAVGDPDPVVVDATLATDNPVPFTIWDNLATDVTYVFEVDGDLVPLADGSLDIDVAFDEDDGVCTPSQTYDVAVWTEGDWIDAGDGWQSFTANADSLLYSVGFYWNIVGFHPGYTIEIYEGEGTGGPLLFSQSYAGYGDNVSLLGFDFNGVSPPVLLEEGQVYTIAGIGTVGWQTALGALPGASSSEGDTRHKNVRAFAELCD